MKIDASDYLLVQFSGFARPLLKWLGDWETRSLASELSTITIDRPIFIAGLARSGTTILLEILAKIGGIATHRYRDFPFLMIPFTWNRYLDRFRVEEDPVERAHGDRIRITRESPEAFEEPIWQAFFPYLHDPDAVHCLSGRVRCDRFESFYKDHIRKILLLRGGDRYLSKGNYNLPRIEYLTTLFPDARFIVPIRDPLAHVHSLVRQHRRFSDYAAQDPRVPRYMAAAGHYEFGPQRVAIRFTREGGDRIRAAWDRGDDYAGYAIQWSSAYQFIASLVERDDEISERILIVRYEDFCANPAGVVGRVLEHARIVPGAASELGSLESISKSTVPTSDLPEAVRATVWNETASIARHFGYGCG